MLLNRYVKDFMSQMNKPGALITNITAPGTKFTSGGKGAFFAVPDEEDEEEE
jgi:hypothetical protein